MVVRTLEGLGNEVVAYLQRLSYSESRISQYRSAWQRLAVFMKQSGLEEYSASVGDLFNTDLIGARSYHELDRWEKDIIQCANVLTEFQETGAVKFKRNHTFRTFNGAIGDTMREYIGVKKSRGMAQDTLDEYRLYLHRFLHFLSEQGLSLPESISQQHLLAFANQLGFYTPYTRHRMLSITRGYVRHLYDQNHMKSDLSHFVPKGNFKKQRALPSVFSMAEVDSLIAAIDRSSPKGKRDYAMVLLAARLGLRASDICIMTFNNLNWEQSLIVLTQQKTGRRIELPLLSKIGDGIIDYLKHGRPVSSLPYIFLSVNSPYDRLYRSTLHSIICLYLRKAGIKYKGERRGGPHALRHSLAGILLEKKTPIPVIAEVLGHKNTESTKLYLRIDLTSLRQCALEVPSLLHERGIVT